MPPRLPSHTPASAPPDRSTPGALIRFAIAGQGRGRLLALASAARVLHQVGEALVPVLIGVTIDRAIAPGDPGQLLLWLLVLAANFLVLSFSWRYSSRWNAQVFLRGEHELRLRAARRVLHPHGMLSPRSAGENLTIATNDASAVSGFAWLLVEQGAALAGLVTAVISLVLLSPPLALAVIAATVVQLVVVFWLSRPLDERVYTEQRLSARAGSLATDLATGVRVLKGLRAEKAASERYRTASESSARAAVATARARSTMHAVNAVVSGLVLLGIVAMAASSALDGVLSIGGLVAVVGLAQYVRGPLESIGYLIGEYAAKRGAARRLGEIIGAETAIPLTEAPVAEAAAAQPGAPALRVHGAAHEAIEVSRGELVGVRADQFDAERLLDALAYRVPLDAGHIALDGIDARALGVDGVRERMFAPAHESAVFRGSAADNLHAEPDPARLRASAFTEVLEHLPDGLGSDIGENGGRLSGGQRQRLLLARALHQDHPVLVLHEPTTAVDSVTEDEIARALAAQARTHGRAIVLVTMSPALLGVCDRVVEITTEQHR